MLQRFALGAGLVLLSVASSNAAGDWPEFRGPTGQGHAAATRLPLEWSNTRNLAWKQAIPGSGWSSPALKDGRVFLTSAVGGDGGSTMSLHALCLDERSGKILWDIEVFGGAQATRIHTKNSHASPTPLIADGRIYVHFGHQGTACLDPDGKVLWRQASLNYAPVHGSGGSPILAGDALIFSCDGASKPFVVALDKANGTVLSPIAFDVLRAAA